MSDHGIEKTACAQQAVREFTGCGRLPFPRNVRKKIDRLLKQIGEQNVVFVDGIYHPSTELAALLKREITVRIDGAVVNVNPFSCDLIDIFRMIKALDADQAQQQNGQGFNKVDSMISRRLLSKTEGQALTPGNVVEMYVIAHRYRRQAVGEISRMTGMKVSEVSGIIETRFKSNGVTRSMRIVTNTGFAVSEEP
jgi:uridine kinase